MTISATLELNQAMAALKQSILPLLAVGDIASWDGPKLKEREESIRQATLVLAGQIIALLMNQLSEHPDSQREAKQRTQLSWGCIATSQGKRRLSVLTVGNVAVELTVSYVLGRAPQKRRKGERKAGQRGPSRGQGYYPVLCWLGMEEKVSPLVLIADGAPWIWQRIPVLLERLGLPKERLIEGIDLYHASGHLKAFAEAALVKPKLVGKWFGSARSSLKRGKLPRLLKQMQQMMQQKHSKKRSHLAAA